METRDDDDRARTARRGGGSPHDRILTKVRALLAKAESTAFEAEADALTAKAQELMARHALTEAMLETGAGPSDDPERRDIALELPYVAAKAFLLGRVASANRCQIVWSRHPARAAVFGFPGDLEAVELLYTSLLVQVARAITAVGPVRDAAGVSRTRSFRRSFLLGFAARIGERLREATASSAHDVEAEAGSSLLPVLASRAQRVEEAVRATFPHTVAHRFSSSHGGGYRAGWDAGGRASLTNAPGVTRSSRPALGLG